MNEVERIPRSAAYLVALWALLPEHTEESCLLNRILTVSNYGIHTVFKW